MRFAAAAAAAAFAAVAAIAAPLGALAQACQPDVLVDDFRARDSTMYRTQPTGTGCENFPGTFNGCNKTLNLLGGDYGDSGADETMTLGQLKIVSGNNSVAINGLEAASHPNTAVTFNYWYVKFNWENDFDLTPYTAMVIDLIAPAGSDFNVTLTQWIPATPGVRDGKGDRGIDSSYHLLSSYLTPSGSPQTLVMPISDFSTNLNGGKFDLANLKDLTLVNFGPIGATFTFTKITLRGNCSSSSSSGTSPTGTATGSSKSATVSPTGTTTSSKSAAKKPESSAALLAVLGLAGVAALLI
ncbi:hypothetical protein DFJ73DRAFT_965667 [Zopfochytrium polystomum]|nr:hypothetical protein DFJ73DRAFT_965667 [Zopfochytrium polystomum]